MTNYEKLQLMFDELKKRGVVRTQKQLASLIGAAESTLSNAFRVDSKYCTQSLLARINDNTGRIFNSTWLFTGEGPMLAEQRGDTFGYTTHNGDVNTNTGSGTQNVRTGADPEELSQLRSRVRELEIENARLQGMIEILKEK